MSGQSDIISFDLQLGKGNVLDVASMFPISETHAIRTTKPILDTLKYGEGKIYDFSLGHTLSVKRFRTLVTLDLSTPEFWKPSLLTSKILSIRPRFHTIDLVPPLEIPFGSLDMRSLRPIFSKRTYPDLYKRTLPASLHIRREWRNIRSYVKSKKKPIIATGIGLILLSVPALLYSKMLIEDGYARLISLRSLRDRTSIIASIRESSRDFERANILFMPFRIIPSDQIGLGAIAIDGGLSISRGMKALVDSLPDALTGTTAMIEYSAEDTMTPSYRAKARDISPLVPLGIDIPTDWLEKNTGTLAYLKSSFTDASQAFARVEKLNDPRKETLLHVSQTFSELARILDFYQSHQKNLLTMLGHTDPQRYIVFNQNRDEIRANGGFPGSVITFTLYKGNILDYRTDDIYYYDWNLYPYKESPPPGIALISGNYGLRDVNYYPDFRDTLEKANSFVEQSGDATLTTGIAIHQGMIEDLLRSVGPVTLSGIAIPFTADNFSPLMSTLVEARHGEVNSPKDTLFRFISALGAKIGEKHAYDSILSSLEDAVKNGEILFASRDTGVDEFLSNYRPSLPWQCEGTMNNEQGTMNNEQGTMNNEQGTMNSGEAIRSNISHTGALGNQKTCAHNWAYPLLTSVSGNKSDRFMSRLYQSETSIIGTCRYENKITFTHTENYSKADTVNLEKYMDLIGLHDAKAREKMLFIQGNGKNRIYMRLYVPKGSTLTGSTVGVETVKKEEATVFTWLLETPLSSSVSKTIRYVTDVPGCSKSDEYLTWYRQPGLQHTTMKSK